MSKTVLRPGSKLRCLVMLAILLFATPWVFAQMPDQSISNGEVLPMVSPVIDVLYRFPFDGLGASGYSHGKVPYSELVQGADGNFYGTTVNGGDSSCTDGFGIEGCGTIFKITPAGIQTVLYSFKYDPITNTAVNGIYPYGGLVQGRDGNFYGTTADGGNPSAGCIHGCGVVFRITPSGQFTQLHQFGGGGANPPEGANPAGRLILASDGKLYGTTYSGGQVQGSFNQGTLFSITSGGIFTTLHQFDNLHGVTDGANPYAGLVQGADGNFYGTTYFGGTDGVGTVFRFSKSAGVTVLHSFVQPSHGDFPDGAYPQSALVQATDGNLYGATTAGGLFPQSDGALFRITTDGVFLKLYDFNPPTGGVLGFYPLAGMIQASDGHLYGTTELGGPTNCSCGTVYQMTLAGAVSQVTDFDDADTGRWPLSVPLQAADGRLYITNSKGPSVLSHDPGTIIQIDRGLPKPKPSVLSFSPKSGQVGMKVLITGSHFVGTTSVKFHGTAASFTVKSTGALVAAVPAGATTGPITVTTSGGSATSTATFTVP